MAARAAFLGTPAKLRSILRWSLTTYTMDTVSNVGMGVMFGVIASAHAPWQVVAIGGFALAVVGTIGAFNAKRRANRTWDEEEQEEAAEEASN